MQTHCDGLEPAQRRLRAILAKLEGLVDWEKRQRGGMQVTIEPIRDLLARLGRPDQRLRVVHVTGTKGKGTLTTLVAQALQAHGWRAAAYCSPHVEALNERLWIAGALVGDEPLAESLEAAWAAHAAALAEGSAAREATWFDLLTAAAVWRAAQDHVEWIVLEVGIGGRLDSTNALDGEVCALTNVELEHTQLLGSTRAAIAFEKSAIVKAGASVVTGLEPGCAPWSDAAGAVLEARAARVGARVLRPAGYARLPLDKRGAALAGLVLDELGRRGLCARRGVRLDMPLGAWCLDQALVGAARLPGRWERFESSGRSLWLDGAHVPESLEALLAHIAADPACAGKAGTVVFGCGKDKDSPGLFKSLLGRADRVVCTSVGVGLAASAEDLLLAAQRAGVVAETAAVPRMAFERALELTPPGGWLLITGSLHLVGALRGEVLRRAGR